jgi:hypothetical protein
MIMQITITVNETQAYVIMNALETYSRLLMGQFNEIDTLFVNNGNDVWKDFIRRQELEMRLKSARKCVYPMLEDNAYYGIFDKVHTPNNSRIAWDIKKAIEHDLSWHKYPEGGITTNFDTPMHSAEEVPLAMVTITEVE